MVPELGVLSVLMELYVVTEMVKVLDGELFVIPLYLFVSLMSLAKVVDVFLVQQEQ
jgi:hypothetical protein